MLQTEFEFVLPKGYVDASGNLHKSGLMRLATGDDEITPMKDPRVNANNAYLTILVLSRVVTKLGELEDVGVDVIGRLFASDLSFLQDLYQRINYDKTGTKEVTCPKCACKIQVDSCTMGG